MPIETSEGGISISGDAMELYRVLSLRSALSLYLKTGMKVNRAYTPTNMRTAATQYTGATYARSRKGLQAAHDDLAAMIKAHEGQDADQTGEAFQARRTQT